METLMPTPSSWIRWQVVAPLVMTLALLLYLVVTRAEKLEMPHSIAGIDLTRIVAGKDAAEVINHLHGKGVSPSHNSIAIYAGEKGSAILYLSVYAEEKEAEESLDRMRSAISQGNPVFAHYTEVEVSGRIVYFCVGQGQSHYFFRHQDKLYWLAADRGIARVGLEELLTGL